MVLSDTKTDPERSPIDDVSYLTRSEHRVSVLVALTDRSRSRSELSELTGVSSSTIRRTLCEFEARNWIRRDGSQFEATQLGTFVAATMTELLERFDIERTLRDVWHWLPGDESGFTIELCADAVVTVADSNDPYAPVNRFESLLRETSEFRFVGSDVALLEPCKDVLRRRIVDGMRTEIIDPPRAARYILSTYPEHCVAPLESGELTVFTHDDLPPYGIGLFDDRVIVSCYEENSGTVSAVIDTPVPAAREWAESVYDRYRSAAQPLEPERLVE